MNIAIVLCTIDSTFRRNYFMSELKNQISQFIDTNAKVYQDISLAIHAKPEVSDFEYFASQTLSEQLKKKALRLNYQRQDIVQALRQPTKVINQVLRLFF